MSYNDFKYETVIMGNIQTVPIRHRAFAIVTLSLHSWTPWSADYPYYLVRKKSYVRPLMELSKYKQQMQLHGT